MYGPLLCVYKGARENDWCKQRRGSGNLKPLSKYSLCYVTSKATCTFLRVIYLFWETKWATLLNPTDVSRYRQVCNLRLGCEKTPPPLSSSPCAKALTSSNRNFHVYSLDEKPMRRPVPALVTAFGRQTQPWPRFPPLVPIHVQQKLLYGGRGTALKTSE